MDERIRLPHDQTVGDLTPAELLEKFWQASHVPEEDIKALHELASLILQEEVEEEADEAVETVGEKRVEEEALALPATQ